MKLGQFSHAPQCLRRMLPPALMLALVGMGLGLMDGSEPWHEALAGNHLRRAAGAAARDPQAPSARLHASPRADASPGKPAQLLGAYAELPLSFEANQGQTDPQVKFLSRGPGYSLFLTPTEAVLALHKSRQASNQACVEHSSETETLNSKVRIRTSPEPRLVPLFAGIPNPAPPVTSVLRMRLVGANPRPQVRGLHELPGKSNYFLGNDPERWRTNVPNYAKVRYEGVYPGVDLVYYGHQRQLEYDFVVSRGADPGIIRLSFGGLVSAQPLHVDAQGDLLLRTAGGVVRFHKPVAYQPDAAWRPATPDFGHSVLVDGHYRLQGEREVGFEVASYDASRPLVIDPVLSYATYLGGSADDAGYGIAVDSSGDAYITGSTGSTNFPTVSPVQSATGGPTDAFVAKLKADGSALLYSTYLGGAGFDRGTSIALDASGNAYVTGVTASNNFPTTTKAFQTTFGGGTCGTSFCSDAFVAKVKADGSALAYSTYLGGNDADFGQGIAVDSAGNAYVTGSTLSSNFPTASPLQAARGGNSDAFVTKLSADGTALVYSTYLGGTGADTSQGIALDSAGNAYIAGYTSSKDFPTLSPIQAALAGGSDAFVAELNAAGSALVYSTYFGGSGLDRATGIAVDAAGNAYVTGDTTSSDLPVTLGAYSATYHGNGDAFVAKLNAGGTGLAFASYLGGADTELGGGVAVDASGNVYLTGSTRSGDFPPSRPLQAVLGGGTCNSSPCFDAFVTELDAAGSTLVYSTFLGGNGADYGRAIALDSSGNAYVTGPTTSSNFAVTAGAAQSVFGGSVSSGDAFVAKIGPADAPGVSLMPQKLTFGDQATGTTSPVQTVTLIDSGSATLNIASIVPSGDFGVASSGTCGTSLAPGGASCTIDVTFSPTATGARTGAVTITDDAASSPQTIALTGNGVTPAPAVTFSPTSLDFGDLTAGTESAPQAVLLTNSGSADLTITKVAVVGQFKETDNCANVTLTPKSSCTFNISFAPTSTGTQTGTIDVTDNATGSPQKLSLKGNAVAAYALSSDISSVTLSRGTDSTTFNISASTQAGYTASISLSCSGNSSITCVFDPTAIKPGETSKLAVSKLSVITSTTVSFSVTGASGTGTSAQSASTALTILLGDFSISAAPPLGSVAAGESANYTLALTPVNGFNGTVNLSCVNLPHGATCSFQPAASPKLDGTSATNVTVAVKTTTRSLGVDRGGRRMLPPGMGRRVSLPWQVWLMALVGALAALGAVSRRRQWSWAARMAPLAGLALVAVLWAGCNNYYYDPIAPANPGPGTPAATYTIGITGTFTPTTGSPVSHSTTVNLTVS